MKVTIGSTSYTQIKALSFAPEVDITCATLQVNTFMVDVMTDDTIRVGRYATLYDDNNWPWAKYWIVSADRIDKYTVRVYAESPLRLLDRIKLPAVMYDGESSGDLLDAIFNRIGGSEIFERSHSSTVSGFCPEQTARERVQWLCFVSQIYLKSFYGTKIYTERVSDSITNIEKNHVFWKPEIEYGDYVTGIKMTAYTYAEGTPSSTDKWVEAGGVKYIVTTQEFTVSATGLPSGTPENVIEINDVQLVNPSNVTTILNNLALYYFNRQSVTFDAINNREFEPGTRIQAYVSEDAVGVGYIASCDFSFGLQARSKIHMSAVELIDCDTLTITYKYGSMTVGQAKYSLPIDYAYVISNPYFDVTIGTNRYIFYPLTATCTGTMVDGGVAVDVDCGVAVDFQMLSTRSLKIIMADEVSESDGTLVIG